MRYVLNNVADHSEVASDCGRRSAGIQSTSAIEKIRTNDSNSVETLRTLLLELLAVTAVTRPNSTW